MTLAAETKVAVIIHAFGMLLRSAATSLFLSAVLCGQAQVTSSVQVATMAPNNRTVAVYYRVPKGYDASRQESYRVLVIFGGRNVTGAAGMGRMGR